MRLLVLLASVAVSACDEDIFLSGKWIPSGITAEEARDLGRCLGRCPEGVSDESCELYFEVSMGHFGEDVVGVIRFFENESRQREAECRPAEGLYCTCSSIEGVYRESRMDFAMRDCGDVLHDAVMTRVDSETVELTIKKPGVAGCDALTLTKVLNEDQLTVRDKACTECRAEQ